MIQRLRMLRRGRSIGLGLVLLFVGAAVWVLWQGGSQLTAQAIQLNPLFVFWAFAISSVGLLLAVMAWRLILAGYGVRQSWRDDVRIYCYSALGVALPGSIWTIVGRSALYSRLGANSVRVATASVVETFVIGIAALGVYAITAVIRPGINLWQRPEIGIGFSISVLCLIHPRVFNRLSRWVLRRSGQSKEFLLVDFRFRELLLWVALEAIIVTIGGAALFALLSSLIEVPSDMLIWAVAAWAAAVSVSALFFWLPGTWLLHDGAMVLALSPSVPVPLAVVFAVIVRIWSIASLLVVAGLVWVFIDQPYKITGTHDQP